MPAIRLGLIGNDIRGSRAPALHRLFGESTGLEVSYDLFVPRALGLSFDQAFAHCRDIGLRGVNITLPYKETAAAKVRIDSPLTRRIGSLNTVVFAKAGPVGFNTDYSGFLSAYREMFGNAQPGRVTMIGAGGVGKAVAFALVALGAREVTILDSDAARAEALARAVAAAGGGATAGCIGEPTAFAGADGVINCTPLGMTGHPGSPVPDGAFPRCRWAFDAVYTPMDTVFRAQAEDAGARFLSGFELHFHQGVDAFEIFTGKRPAGLARLRRAHLSRMSPAGRAVRGGEHARD
ncbi:MAG: shikimate dehydrogenase family protein [Paracoccaceae bacterium]